MKIKHWPNFSENLIFKVGSIIRSGNINYTNGKYGIKFEREFSRFIGNQFSIAVCNGTAALEVAIKSLRLPKKSQILVSARSFFSSASCIVNTGNIPVFVDVDLKTQNISLVDLKKKITKKTKAIICVHLAGMPCDMDSIKKIVSGKNIKIIEDCSQAHGASINDKMVGSFGDVSAWSFCNDKIISTLGEGGMISTNKKRIYDYCKRQINHGTNPNNQTNYNEFVYNKDYFGTNLRITEIQSFAGLNQLKNLKKIQKIREKISKDYYDIIYHYNKYFLCHYPIKQYKSAWYRFYFFVKKENKNYKKIRSDIIKNLKKNNFRSFTGSCPEIYLEKSFKKLKNFKIKRLKNCKVLGETSIALDLNHTLNILDHKKNLIKMKKIFDKVLKHQQLNNG